MNIRTPIELVLDHALSAPARLAAIVLRARPEFLIHALTGQRMEYDVWFPADCVAFEFNGTPHDR